MKGEHFLFTKNLDSLLFPILYNTSLMALIKKVYAYITRGEQLLVFRQLDFPEAGLQVPGGTMETDELPEVAVLREAAEETGLEALQLVSYLGCDEYALPESDQGEVRLRHFYHLLCEQDAPDNWQHYELHTSDGSKDPILFEFYWLPVEKAQETLNPYFTARLNQLIENMADES